MKPGSFYRLSPKTMIEAIDSAQSLVCFAAPGISLEMAQAICRFADQVGNDFAKVLVDASPESCRMGYGEVAALECLEKKGVDVRGLAGLRIAVLIVDGFGWALVSPPLIVESYEERPFYNAIRLSDEQLGDFYTEFFSELAMDIATPPHPSGVSGLEACSFEETTGLGDELVDDIKSSLDKDPPQKFDLARKVRVFNSYVEFVELKLNGAMVDRRRLKLSGTLKEVLASNKDVAERLNASYRLIDDGFGLSSKPISNEVDRIREVFLPKLGSLGRVILRSKRSEFDKNIENLKSDIEEYKDLLVDQLKDSIASSRQVISKQLTLSVKQNPPSKLSNQSEGEVTEDIARRFVDDELDKCMPDTEKLIEQIKLSLNFKSVTYEMLSDPKFQSLLRESFPYVSWEKPLKEFDTLVPENEQ